MIRSEAVKERGPDVAILFEREFGLFRLDAEFVLRVEYARVLRDRVPQRGAAVVRANNNAQFPAGRVLFL